MSARDRGDRDDDSDDSGDDDGDDAVREVTIGLHVAVDVRDVLPTAAPAVLPVTPAA